MFHKSVHARTFLLSCSYFNLTSLTTVLVSVLLAYNIISNTAPRPGFALTDSQVNNPFSFSNEPPPCNYATSQDFFNISPYNSSSFYLPHTQQPLLYHHITLKVMTLHILAHCNNGTIQLMYLLTFFFLLLLLLLLIHFTSISSIVYYPPTLTQPSYTRILLLAMNNILSILFLVVLLNLSWVIITIIQIWLTSIVSNILALTHPSYTRTLLLVMNHILPFILLMILLLLNVLDWTLLATLVSPPPVLL